MFRPGYAMRFAGVLSKEMNRLTLFLTFKGI